MVILWKDAQGHSTQGPPSLLGYWMPSQNHPQLPKPLWSSWIERESPWEGSLGSQLVCLVIFTVVTCKLLVTIFTLKDVPLQSQLECLILFLSVFLSSCPFSSSHFFFFIFFFTVPSLSPHLKVLQKFSITISKHTSLSGTFICFHSSGGRNTHERQRERCI